jgi:hypothetical protein
VEPSLPGEKLGWESYISDLSTTVGNFRRNPALKRSVLEFNQRVPLLGCPWGNLDANVPWAVLPPDSWRSE